MQGALGAPTILGTTVLIAAAGGQIRRRLVGSFRSSFYAGAEVLASRGPHPTAARPCCLAGPLLGYKQSFGTLTLDIQGGVGLLGATEPM